MKKTIVAYSLALVTILGVACSKKVKEIYDDTKSNVVEFLDNKEQYTDNIKKEILDILDGNNESNKLETMSPIPTIEPTPIPTIEPTPIPTIEPTPAPVVNSPYNIPEGFYNTGYYGYIIYDTDAYDMDWNYYSHIETYQKVYSVGSDGYTDKVILENGNECYILNSSINIMPNIYVEVDIEDQKIYLYKDNELFLSSSIVTGKLETPTYLGCFDIYAKETDRYLEGEGYKSYVNYWMPFNSNIGFHDASWRDNCFGGQIYQLDGSHGCVNLPFDTAESLYNNVDINTLVLVHN